jgi:hypothetical protein
MISRVVYLTNSAGYVILLFTWFISNLTKGKVMKASLFFIAIAVFLFSPFISFAGDVGVNNEKFYMVESGDTFSEICLVFMENGLANVYTREASRLGIINPDLIYPGQLFAFPNVYRVAWKSKEKGFQSHGSWDIDQFLIQEWVLYGNVSCPEINHWVEKK